MDLTLDLLSIQNPWWSLRRDRKHQSGWKFDPVLRAYHDQPLKWWPEFLERLEFNCDKVYALFGPRGAGKTTLMKLEIKKLLEAGVEADNIFYYSCHNLDSYEQLNEIIKMYLEWRPGRKRCLYIFIDEINLLKNWQAGLSFLVKAGKLKKSLVMTAGSMAASSLAGSQTKNSTKQFKDIKLAGLNFREFVNLINPALVAKIKPANFIDYQYKLDYYLDIYCLTGGFIAHINEYKKEGAVKQVIYDNYLAWFMADLAKQGRDAVLARQIVEKLLLNLGRPLGYKTIARNTRAKTHLTVAEYLEVLQSMLVIKTIYQSEDGRPTSRKAKKVYFPDPFLFWLFYSHVHGSLDYWQFSREHLHEEAIFSSLVENIVFANLAKGDEFSRGQTLTYWRDNIRNENIDFVVRRRGKAAPVLIRYNKEIGAKDLAVFAHAGFKQGLVISRDKLDLSGKIKIVPLTYFLLFGEKFI